MSKNTVFIIGAGASKEAGLPLGGELKQEISNLLDISFEKHGQKTGSQTVTDALRLHVQNLGNTRIEGHLKEAHNIARRLPLAMSIDNYLNQHRDNEEAILCGKLAITRAILRAERSSDLHRKDASQYKEFDYDLLEKTWYLSFFKLLTENCTVNELAQRLNSVSLIIFNYDRCIEHFLHHALQIFYGVDEQMSAEILDKTTIYHPYGDVGPLPCFGQGEHVDFGAEPAPDQLLSLAGRIRTFTEGTNQDSSNIHAIRDNVSTAYRIVFLGFAFHKLNVELICPPGGEGEIVNRQIFATAHGISDSDCEQIERDISEPLRAYTLNVKMAKIPCRDFIPEFWRSLAFDGP